jgi:prepilin-type processing-associated H-X9-DG protein
MGLSQSCAMDGNRQTAGKRVAFTVLELLVTASVVGMLMGLLLPAIMSARESARRMQCTNHLHQLGLAMQQYHNTARRLPAAWTEASDKTTGYAWAVDLLPVLEEAQLHARVERQVPIVASQNDLIRNTDLPLMRCPSDIADPTFELLSESPEPTHNSHSTNDDSAATSENAALVQLPTANYVGVFGTLEADDSFPAPNGDGPIVVNRRVRFADLERGQTHTLIVGERTAAMVPSTWFGVHFHGEDAACRIVGSAMTSPNCEPCDECEFASRHSGGANFVWADGHVSLVADDVDPAEYRRFAQRQAD